MRKRLVLILVVAMVAAAAIFVVRGLSRRSAKAAPIPTEAVERRDITVTVDATGTVEPVNLVEVKSKASGQILRMPVEIGSVVKRADLLAQIDSSDVRNQYDQAFAALQAARAKHDVSDAQNKRADALYKDQIITADEHETALLDFANAQSQLVTARTNLDIARQRLADATVRAPIAGTIIDEPVSVGQVISSATSSVSGGTTLLLMADLRRIRVRALVSESDIGSVHAGQAASVQVDAYPQRPFQGEVEKIEPQAVVQQSVTMFPVLVSISNEDGLLLPGMNGEVTVLIQQRNNVVSVSMDAVRTMREIPAIAAALGTNADSVRAHLEAQMKARGLGMGRMGARADSANGQRQWAGRDSSGTRGSRRGAGGGGAGAGAQRGGGAGGAAGGTGGAGMAGGTGSGRANRAQIVFVKTAQGLEPRLVRLGLSNFDYAEVLDGVNEGDQVALLSVAELQAQRAQNLDRIRQRVGTGVPGVGGGSGTGAGGAGGAGGGGGARRGGP